MYEKYLYTKFSTIEPVKKSQTKTDTPAKAKVPLSKTQPVDVWLYE